MEDTQNKILQTLLQRAQNIYFPYEEQALGGLAQRSQFLPSYATQALAEARGLAQPMDLAYPEAFPSPLLPPAIPSPLLPPAIPSPLLPNIVQPAPTASPMKKVSPASAPPAKQPAVPTQGVPPLDPNNPYSPYDYFSNVGGG